MSMTKNPGKKKRKRLHGAGRKALDLEMEEELFSWIIELRSRNLRVSRKMIRQQARSQGKCGLAAQVYEEAWSFSSTENYSMPIHTG